uniref:ATP synthase subunit a n=3 Tax=Pampus TaxID=163125 RepID=U5N4W6_9SCOM|nr:ATP synthase F0 subunit 6 [Pampus chinensis]YP_009227686.1 ATP synthase F0 subunit 6 [Pampus cinereus]AGX85249.1 ATP synthase F0 subunit 6 [Pampus punctatissimus]AHN49768.1 ATP synthase F0 subunit 6 [Pampus punctatissimus]AHN52507.1 ATP synthase F0 subunit 6 [Pampus cinereus]AHX59167.1 ATP synthase F0 subunit 6 [Pampus chinensis]
MTLSLFNQFAPTYTLLIPSSTVAVFIPWLLFPTPTKQWLNNRLTTTQNWFIAQLLRELFLPIKPTGHKWALLFVALAMYLTFLNLLGLLPYTFTPTSQLSHNLGFAIPFWLVTVLIGFQDKPTEALAHLLPEGTPTPLIPVLIIIETISLFIRPLALAVRLTANITAGHLLIQLVAKGTLALLSIMPAVAILTTVLLILLTLLEVAVAMIQAYVFVLLLSLYLQENV